MSTSNKSLLSTSMSILDGSNYLVWESQMKAWLRSKGLWQITNGHEREFPQVPDMESTTTNWQANYKAWMEWDNKDDQAYGSILLWVNLSVAVLAASSATAMAAWAAFRQTGPSAIFTEFRSAISQEISMVSPALDIMAMNKNFQHYGCFISDPRNCAGNDFAKCNTKGVWWNHTDHSPDTGAIKINI